MDTALEESFDVDEWKLDGYTTASGRSIQVLIGTKREEDTKPSTKTQKEEHKRKKRPQAVKAGHSRMETAKETESETDL